MKLILYWWGIALAAPRKKRHKRRGLGQAYSQSSFIHLLPLYILFLFRVCLRFTILHKRDPKRCVELFAGSNYLAFKLKLALELLDITEYVCTFIASAILPPPTFPPPTFLYRINLRSLLRVLVVSIYGNIVKIFLNLLQTVLRQFAKYQTITTTTSSSTYIIIYAHFLNAYTYSNEERFALELLAVWWLAEHLFYVTVT